MLVLNYISYFIVGARQLFSNIFWKISCNSSQVSQHHCSIKHSLYWDSSVSLWKVGVANKWQILKGTKIYACFVWRTWEDYACIFKFDILTGYLFVKEFLPLGDHLLIRDNVNSSINCKLLEKGVWIIHLSRPKAQPRVWPMYIFSVNVCRIHNHTCSLSFLMEQL